MFFKKLEGRNHSVSGLIFYAFQRLPLQVVSLDSVRRYILAFAATCVSLALGATCGKFTAIAAP